MSARAALALVAALAAVSAGAAPAIAETFHLALTVSSFKNVNENDARAALKAWGIAVSRDRALELDVDVQVFRTNDELTAALRTGHVDALTLSVPEFVRCERDLGRHSLFGAVIGSSVGDTYAVVVRRGGPNRGLADLRGKRIIRLDNMRTELAVPWIDHRLVAQGLPPLARLCARVSATSKVSEAILPVFFGQADACLVTRYAFETMKELNPQLGSTLAALEVSPEIVSTVFVVRHTLPRATHERLMPVLRELHRLPSGQQVLNIFATEMLRELDPAEIEYARTLCAAPATPRTPSATRPARARALAGGTGDTP